MTPRTEIDQYLHELLDVPRFRDYGPNGLQVEGKPVIRKIVSGVTASLALIEAAKAADADAIVVHHGLFWRGHDGRVTGWLKTRLERLLARQVNLFAYHLPLDAHPEWGNNAQLGRRLGWTASSHFGEQELGCCAELGAALSLDELGSHINQSLGRVALVVPGDGRAIRRAAWCTGGAQDYFEAAIAAGADVYLTGEISEPQAHYAKETGVVFIAAGHHATERYGVQALGEHLARHFKLDHQFIDIDNPA